MLGKRKFPGHFQMEFSHLESENQSSVADSALGTKGGRLRRRIKIQPQTERDKDQENIDNSPNNSGQIVQSKNVVAKVDGKKQSTLTSKVKEERPCSTRSPQYRQQNTYAVGDLFWGQVHKCCYWPCMVSPDDEGKTISAKEVHVLFFADKRRHSWVRRENVIPYTTLRHYRDLSEECYKTHGPKSVKCKFFKPKKRYEPKWNDALSEMEMLAKKPREMRLEKFFEMFEKSNTMESENQTSVADSVLDTKGGRLSRRNKIQPQTERDKDLENIDNSPNDSEQIEQSKSVGAKVDENKQSTFTSPNDSGQIEQSKSVVAKVDENTPSTFTSRNDSGQIEQSKGVVAKLDENKQSTLTSSNDSGQIEQSKSVVAKVVENKRSTFTSPNASGQIELSKSVVAKVDQNKQSTFTSIVKEERPSSTRSSQNTYAVGDLFWGQVHKCCYWPCMVSPDDEGKTISAKEVHVLFFADKLRHCWVRRENVIPYTTLRHYRDLSEECYKTHGPKSVKCKYFKPKRRYEPKWNEALSEMEMLAKKPREIRLEMFWEMFEKSKELQKKERSSVHQN